MSYYSAVSTILWISLIILCVLVHENDRLRRTTKMRFYITYILIFLASVSEWGAIQLNGNENIPSFLIRLVKCCDYICTPLAGAAFIGQMRLKSIWTKAMNVIIATNIVFQILSLFTDWMITIDDNNYYAHGSLYTIYIIEYLLITTIVILQFLIYGKRFRNENRFSLYLILLIVLLGIFMQEIFGGEIRTAYLALTIGAYMMFVHTMEFAQQRTDEHILEQQIKITTDALTGLQSRYAYSRALETYRSKMPSDFVAFSIDINGLKTTNDTMGHDAGDELICGSARCIEEVFADYGACFRTGGDEFIVLASMTPAQVKESMKRIADETSRWSGDVVKSLSLSVGYALQSEHQGTSCEELVKYADKRMYEAKDRYYRKTGLSRRET
ncbi:MAG: GGDEF domain-containing protein [Clostridiales bacterium]|nr:GGDEF domain-containing protein [Clostridiales bacterium]